MKILSIILVLCASQHLFGDFLRLPNHQERSVRQDAPLNNPFWDNSTKMFWFFGTEHLWIWGTKSNSLKKLTHPDFKNRRFVIFAANNIFVATNKKILVINQTEKTVTNLYDSPLSAIVGMHRERHSIIVTSDKHVLIINPHDLSFQKTDHTQVVESSSYYIHNHFWFFSESLGVIKEEGKSKLLSCGARPQSPRILEASIVQYCQNKFYRFAPNGRLIQVIPNVGQHAAIAWSFQPNVHSFLYDNKILEVFNLKKNQKESYLLNNKLSQFLFDKQILAGLTNDFPVLELLTNPVETTMLH